MAIYDIFTFHNEFELLLVRLREHDPFVDKFVLIQGNRFFTGKQKPLYFPFTDPRLTPYLPKIIVKNIQLDSDPETAWINEAKQRNASFEGFEFKSTDIVYLSDLDEIICRNHWRFLLSRLEEEDHLQVWLEAFYYKLNLKQPTQKWIHPKIMKARYFLKKGLTANQVRLDFSGVITPFPCGWHFSWLLDEKGIQEKINAFSHQEFNKPEFNNLVAIKDAIRRRRYLFHREMKLKAVPVDESWPLQMLQCDFWKNYICELEPEKLSLSEHAVNVWVDLAHFIRNVLLRARSFLVPKIKKAICLADPGFEQVFSLDK